MSASTRRWLLLALIAALIAVFFALDLHQRLTLDELRAQRAALAGGIAAHPLASAAAYFCAYVIVTALSLPAASLLTLAGGALFGFGQGLLLVSFAST